MTRLTALGEGGEFDRIRKIWAVLGERGEGGGDDCAIVKIGSQLAAMSVDSSVEGTHFEQGWLNNYELGWRAAAAALSDLAAVAADPDGVLVSLGIQRDFPDEFVTEIMDGVAAVSDSIGAKVWGGDLYRCEKISIGVTVVGSFDGLPVLRSGASLGDSIWITGKLGGAATAVSAFLGGREPDSTCREKLAFPLPRIAEAKWLRERGASAMIDLSDGIKSDAAHLLKASGLAGTVESQTVPRHAGADLRDCELTGGEDYELLFTMPDEDNVTSEEFERKFGTRLTKIGRVHNGNGLTILRDGEPYDPVSGFHHF